MGDNGRKARTCWRATEDAALRRAVVRCGAHKWAAVAGEPGLEGRPPKSCRLRWLNHLAPAVRKERFSEPESRALALGYARHGPRWAHIARELRGRTDSAVKNYWNNHLKRQYAQVLTEILFAPQVTDIRAATIFGVGPSILKAEICRHNSEPKEKDTGNNVEQTIYSGSPLPEESIFARNSLSPSPPPFEQDILIENISENNFLQNDKWPKSDFSENEEFEMLESFQEVREPSLHRSFSSNACESYPKLVSVIERQNSPNNLNMRSWKDCNLLNVARSSCFSLEGPPDGSEIFNKAGLTRASSDNFTSQTDSYLPELQNIRSNRNYLSDVPSCVSSPVRNNQPLTRLGSISTYETDVCSDSDMNQNGSDVFSILDQGIRVSEKGDWGSALPSIENSFQIGNDGDWPEDIDYIVEEMLEELRSVSAPTNGVPVLDNGDCDRNAHGNEIGYMNGNGEEHVKAEVLSGYEELGNRDSGNSGNAGDVGTSGNKGDSGNLKNSGVSHLDTALLSSLLLQ